MHKKPRGSALIINVQFLGQNGQRLGTDVDRDNLRSLFQQLNFNVMDYSDNFGLQADVGCFVMINMHMHGQILVKYSASPN